MICTVWMQIHSWIFCPWLQPTPSMVRRHEDDEKMGQKARLFSSIHESTPSKTIQYAATQLFIGRRWIYLLRILMPINYPFLERLELKTIIYLGFGPGKRRRRSKEGHERKEKDKKQLILEVLENYKQWIDSTDTFHSFNDGIISRTIFEPR